jgi:hypothetical protein
MCSRIRNNQFLKWKHFSKSEYNRDLYLLVPEYAPDLEMMAARMERAVSEEA